MRDDTSSIIEVSTSRKKVVIFMMWPHFTRGSSPMYCLDTRLDCPQSQSAHYGKEEALCPYRE
jgi:hypothetical protein